MKKRRSNGDKVVVSCNTKIKPPKERPMELIKYIGMDVHMAMTVIAVVNVDGKVVTEAIIETKGSTILDFLKGQRGTLHVAFEEGIQAAWLYDLIRPHVARVVVCDPRKLAAQNNKADKPDAKRLAELLRTNGLKPVYHGEHSTQAVKELGRSYAAIVSDGTRVKNRVKALFRGRGISCPGSAVYSENDRQQWLQSLDNAAVRARTSRLWKELDFLMELREESEKELVAEARRHAATKILQSIPGIGPQRAAVILGVVATPHRFHTHKQFWTYCGLAVRSTTSAEYELIQGQVSKSKRRALVRGLNRNYNRTLKEAFKGAAATGPWKSQFDAMVAKGTHPSLVLLTLSRKIASITLAVWKKGERYDENKVKFTHAA